MSCLYGTRLVWQYSSPAPFESGWSIFAKLIALNGLKPSQIRSFIASDKHGQARGDLPFWNGEWINFSRFSIALGVEEDRLRLGFLDQIGFNGSGQRGIKICPACLAKGYHCTFFGLAFFDTCPWHKQKLETCSACFNAVNRLGLSAVPDKKLLAHDPTVWGEWQSSCGHIFFNEGNVAYANSLSLIEQKVISEYCKDLHRWWKKVSQHSGIADHLAQLSEIKDMPLESKFLSAAENIAGKCPWPTTLQSTSIRSHSWIQYATDGFGEIELASRKTDWDITYRAIRRFIERKFLRSHRACWNELKNSNRIDAYRLDSDSACPVALAYACWRLSIEQFIAVEVFNKRKFRNKRIQIRKLKELINLASLKSHAALVYAHFLYIWDELFRHAGIESFEIVHKDWNWYRSHFAIMYVPKEGNTDNVIGEGTIILPDYNHLAKRSFVKCYGKVKCSGWMIYPYYTDTWFTYLENSEALTKSFLFRLKRNPWPRRKVTYNFVGI